MKPAATEPAEEESDGSVSGGEPALRADAGRNRERILAAAQEVFAERGLDASLEEIARRAGVGIATLYRRFPTRVDLIAASFERKMADYAAAVAGASADPDAWTGFCRLIADLCAMQVADAGLKELLTMTLPRSPRVTALKRRSKVMLDDLIGRAQRQGDLRADFVAADVPMFLLANAGIVTVTRSDAPETSARFAAYVIDAVRADRARDLPDPPTDAQMATALATMNRERQH